MDASFLMGDELHRRGFGFDLALASPAKRVVETIAQFEKGFGGPLHPHFREDIYAASAESLLKLLRATDDKVRRVLLVGHNPAQQELAFALAAEKDPLRTDVAAHFPTAAAVLLELPVKRWEELQPGTGKITAYLKPREIAKAR